MGFKVWVSESKLEGPSTSMTFLGFMFDTFRGLVSIPAEKRHRYLSDMKLWKGDRNELESVLGKLLHVSEALKMSRPFLKRIRGDMLQYPRGHREVKLCA